MKALSLLMLLALGAGCSKSTPDPACIDPRKVNQHAVCQDILAPVCGCDGVTYDNSCYADNAGVRAYTAGPCASKPGPK